MSAVNEWQGNVTFVEFEAMINNTSTEVMKFNHEVKNSSPSHCRLEHDRPFVSGYDALFRHVNGRV